MHTHGNRRQKCTQRKERDSSSVKQGIRNIFMDNMAFGLILAKVTGCSPDGQRKRERALNQAKYSSQMGRQICPLRGKKKKSGTQDMLSF